METGAQPQFPGDNKEWGGQGKLGSPHTIEIAIIYTGNCIVVCHHDAYCYNLQICAAGWIAAIGMFVPWHPFNIFEISPKLLLIQIVTLSTENLVFPEQWENSGTWWSVVSHDVTADGVADVTWRPDFILIH